MLADDGYSRERHDNRASRRPLRAKTPHDNVLRRKMGLLRSLDDTNVVLSLERFEFVLLRFDLVCERGHDLCDLQYFKEAQDGGAHSNSRRPCSFVVLERPP